MVSLTMSLCAGIVSVEERLTLKPRFAEEEDCVLCLQSMKGCLVIRTPCGHHFHEKCHAKLRETPASYRYRCPTCRSELMTQIQRMKLYELWGDELWDQYTCYIRSMDGGPAPWERASSKRKNEDFVQWLMDGISEEELSEIWDTDDAQSEPLHSGDDHGEVLLDHGEVLLASLSLDDEFDLDESQPDSP